MTTLHPCPDDDGKAVVIGMPSTPTPLAAWEDAGQVATVVPGGPLPAVLNGVPLAPGAPGAAVQGATRERALEEPPYLPPPGYAAAAGAVIVEDDGRVWLVAPSNRFGGYAATFPKGRLDSGAGATCASLQCASVREAYEESGLHVRVEAFLLDCRRSQTYTRYYLARRIGGSPADMGWESQAVHLVPLARLHEVAVHPNDVPVIAALRARLAARPQGRP